MASLAARNCLLAVLLTAAVVRGERTLADTNPADPVEPPGPLRCEPAPDFSTPAGTLPAARDDAAFDGIGIDQATARPAIAATRGLRPATFASRLPVRTWLFIRSSARTSVYVGVNRRGVAGLHFFQHTPATTSLVQLAPPGGG